MPVRKKGQSLSEYVDICISTRRKEHPEEPYDKTVAACINMGKTFWKPKSKGKKK